MTKCLVAALLAFSMFSAAHAAIDTETSSKYQSDKSNNQRNFNVRLSPLETMFGMPTLSFHYAINDTVSLGVGAMVMTSDDQIKEMIEESDPFFSKEFYEIGANHIEVRADIAIDGDIMGDTYYFAPTIQSMTVTVDDLFFGTSGKAEVLSARALVGHQWMWEHFNINLAGGIITALSESYSFENVSRIDDEDVESLGTGFSLEFGLGLAF